jgi:hypothetical protein
MEKQSLTTKFGTMFATFTSNDHVCISTGDEKGNHFVVNGIAWRLLVHLYRWTDGLFHIGEESKNTYERRMSLHGTRESWTGKYSDAAITQSAREKVAPVIEDHVNTFVTGRPGIVDLAQLEHLTGSLNRADGDYAEAMAAADKARKVRDDARSALDSFIGEKI